MLCVAVVVAAALLVAVAVTAAAGGAPRSASAAGPSILTVPASATGAVGTDIPVDIDVADVGLPGLGGYVVAMQWNPALLSLTSLADSGWVTGNGLIVLCTAPTINNVAGNAELDCTPAPLPFGDGVTTVAPRPIANAVFHALAPGTTAIDLTGSSLLDPFAITVPGVAITSGSATVTSGSATATPSATASPSSVGGVAVPPDVATLASGAGSGSRRTGEIALGIGIALFASASPAGWWLTRRRRRRA